MNEVIAKLTETAWELARIQLEGVKDDIGFNNADKNVGAHLAALIEADPSDIDSVKALAALVGGKYRGQTEKMVGEDMLAEFKALAKGTKLTPEQRAAAKRTVIVQPDVHPQYGARVLFSFQYNQDFGYTLRNCGAKAFSGPDGWKWALPPHKFGEAVEALVNHGARIVGADSVNNAAFAALKATDKRARVVKARLDGSSIYLSFAYDAALVDAIKGSVKFRKYDPQSREWRIKACDLAIVVEAMQNSTQHDSADLSELLALASQVEAVSRPVEVEDKPVTIFQPLVPADPHQVEGIEWLVGSLKEARESEVGGASIRGKIIGDKPGLGKTMQVEVAAKSLLEAHAPNGRIVVICPANYKIGWQREILRFCGPDEKVHLIEGTRDPNHLAEQTCIGPDPTARWNIINWDILHDHYDALVAMGFDVLCADEAHNAKNTDADRSKLFVGGNVSFPKKLSDVEALKIVSDHEAAVKAAREEFEKNLARYKAAGSNGEAPKFKKPVRKWPMGVRSVEGLAANAKLRVFPMTGTPIANRPIDLFNMLKAIGHPLGKNKRDFQMRYCEPKLKKVGKRLYHEFKGKSNLAELRKRIEPVFMQRFEVPGIKPLVREWSAVAVDVEEYRSVMREFYQRRKSGELSSKASILAKLGEARQCTARAMVGATIERIEAALETGAKVIVFSMYSECIKRFKTHFGDSAVVLDGKVTGKNRQAAIDRFQTDDSVRVFIGQGIAASECITLTAAEYVKVNDMDWAPKTHIQAEKRAHRRGQEKTVFIEYMVAAGTFSEDMALMLQEKLEDVNEFEGTDLVLFDNLVERLNSQAPRNDEVRQLHAA